MATLITYDTANNATRELVATYQYAKHRIDASLALIRKHKNLMKTKDAPEGVMSYQEAYDLEQLLLDFQDRMTRLEQAQKKDDRLADKIAAIPNTEPVSVDDAETLSVI